MEVTMTADKEKRHLKDLPSGTEPSNLDNEVVVVDDDGTAVNASGWKDQLHRQYGLLSLCGIALTVDNAWVALGSSISVSIGKMVARFLLTENIDELMHAPDSKWRTSWPYIQSDCGWGILLFYWSESGGGIEYI